MIDARLAARWGAVDAEAFLHHLGPWGFCAACLGGVPPHTWSNNSGRTDFEYGYPLGMTISKSTEVALTVRIRLA